MFDARDRASKRRRERTRSRLSEQGSVPEATAALRAWLEANIRDRQAEQLERLDLDDYLRSTHDIDLAAAERLRLLAVKLKDAIHFKSSRRSWAALERVYQLAIRLAPQDAWMHASRGVSASELAERAERDGDHDLARELHGKAHSSLLRAADYDPADAHIAYVQGHTAYMQPASGPDEALEHFERAIALDPKHPWARLYRAHCLQDQQRWKEAVEAYEAVPKNEFTGPKSWRMDLLVEQRAWCRHKSGDSVGALSDFEQILERYEKQPHLAYWSQMIYLRRAAAGPFPQLRVRVVAVEAQTEQIQPS